MPPMHASSALPPPLTEEMPPWRLYLGLRGRVTRRTFWLHGVLALLVGGVVGLALLEIAGVHPDRAEKWASLMIAWPAIAISAKRWHDTVSASSKARASSAAKGSSSITTLASRLTSSDSGSMLELPSVAQLSSTTAALACRKAGRYSWMCTPSASNSWYSTSAARPA